MQPEAGVFSLLESPFPGLRAFDSTESLLFFGRETHTEALLHRLSNSRFLAVVGSSGCGKSSLVRAGLLPALSRGYLVNATSRWRFAILRPGTSPIDALAVALGDDGVLGPAQNAATLRKTLGATSGGLVEAVRRAGFAAGESLLVVVDQFEEIFRYAYEGKRDAKSQASLFVSSLLRAVESEAPIFVALTMRTDYQGDCAQFPGLPEALNDSQYLVPRLTRDQRRDAVVRPLELVGAAATPRLVNQVLNDAGDDPDQLPVLQHALLQTYRQWQKAGGRGDVDLPEYRAVGGIAEALAKHGDAILAAFPEDDQRLAERIFRCLTKTESGRWIRRAKDFDAICEVVSATDDPSRARVEAIVSAFARREHSLLMLSSPEVGHGTVVDVTHESLIRKWPTLTKWVQDEARSADWYADLTRDVARHGAHDAGLWRDPELSELRKRRDREGWNEAWALQYRQRDNASPVERVDPSFDEVERFLEASSEAQTAERRREEAQRLLDLARAKALARAHRRTSVALSISLATIILAFGAVYLINHRNERNIRSVTQQFVKLQSEQTDALNRAEQAKQALATAKSEYRRARIDSAQQLTTIAKLSKNAEELQAKADRFKPQLLDLSHNTALASSDHNDLIKRIQDLQNQLNQVNVELDKLRSVPPPVAPLQSPDPGLLKTVQDPQAQLRQATQQAAVRPVFIVVHPNSVVRISAAPFAGSVALGVARIHHTLSTPSRVYVWTADGRTQLPQVSKDERSAKDLFAPLEKKSCSADGAPGPACFQVSRVATAKGEQPAGQFTYGGTRYEILATAYNADISGVTDSIALAIFPALQPAATR